MSEKYLDNHEEVNMDNFSEELKHIRNKLQNSENEFTEQDILLLLKIEHIAFRIKYSNVSPDKEYRRLISSI